MKNKSFIYEYWSRTELGREMIASNHVTESDLLFLIPNNVKRRYGLPLTRTSGKKKRKKRQQRKHYIVSFKLFDIIQDVVEKTICTDIQENEFFNEFVEVKNLSLGVRNIVVENC